MTTTSYQKKLDDIMLHSLLGASLCLGRKLKLFEALAEVGTEADPADAQRVAERAGCKERYVKEWLCSVGIGGIVHITPDERFWMDEEQKKALVGIDSSSIARISFLPCILRGYDKLVEVFKKDGPYGMDYSEFSDFYAAMDELTQAMHADHLIPDYFPMIGMDKKLEQGITVLDVGCGSGWHAIQIASTYPKCKVIAFDVTESAIAMAKKAASESRKDLDNLEFHVMDAKAMRQEWTDSFDFVTIFDACHDQTRPDLCIREILRVLKPGGVFAMLEVAGTSNAYEDMQLSGGSAATYTLSTFHCLPVGSNSPDALCLGTKWGEKRARKLLTDCGFEDSKVVVYKPAFFPANHIFVCTK